MPVHQVGNFRLFDPEKGGDINAGYNTVVAPTNKNCQLVIRTSF
jgi:hypothetical protein